MRLPKKQWPEYLRIFKEIKGICYGGCIDGTELPDTVAAHAHCNVIDSRCGWICLNAKSRIRNRCLMYHEVAHLIVGWKAGHNDSWCIVCLDIGGTLNSFKITNSYNSKDLHKKKRST